MIESFIRSVAAVVVALSLIAVSRPAAAAGLPETLNLPNGWQPEGIAQGPGRTLLAGSIVTGAVYQLSPRSGAGGVLVPGQTGRVAVGLKWDQRTDHLYVAGGPTGQVYVYDAVDGSDLAVLNATDEGFVNDQVITRRAVYFTDSLRPVLYRLPLGHGGLLPEDAELEEIPLGGDFEIVEGEFNANGIEAAFGGRSLIVVNSILGTLYEVNPTSGEATLIDLGGASLFYGDGILLRGRTLYVVQNFLNQIAVVSLSQDLSTGEVTNFLTHDDFDVPTTVARFGPWLYAVNARFSTPPTPETSYSIVRVPFF
jgi:hypothetical protein